MKASVLTLSAVRDPWTMECPLSSVQPGHPSLRRTVCGCFFTEFKTSFCAECTWTGQHAPCSMGPLSFVWILRSLWQWNDLKVVFIFFLTLMLCGCAYVLMMCGQNKTWFVFCPVETACSTASWWIQQRLLNGFHVPHYSVRLSTI